MDTQSTLVPAISRTVPPSAPDTTREPLRAVPQQPGTLPASVVRLLNGEGVVVAAFQSSV